jgi:SAM-dependent methyltransferase
LPETARCVDVGCGALGALRVLSRKVGPSGQVLGVDVDSKLLSAAEQFVAAEKLTNVELKKLDVFAAELPAESFDCVHVRFMFAPLGRADELLRQLVRITKRGGMIVVQEPDSASWDFEPSDEAWRQLKHEILHAFRLGGGDFDAGRKLWRQFAEAGFQRRTIRSESLTLPGGHPYCRIGVQFAASLRERILRAGRINAAQLDDLVREGERLAADPMAIMTAFTVVQTVVWRD